MTGVILAGGMSSRFGSDKAQATLYGQTFMEHAFRLLRTICNRVVVSGAKVRGLKAKVRCIPDAVPGGGPMSGIASVVEAVKDEWLMIVPCDMPLISPDLLQTMLTRSGGVLSQVWQGPDGRLQPFPMLLHRPAALKALSAIGMGAGMSIKSMLRVMAHATIPIPSDQLYKFSNINTPQELEVLCHNLQQIQISESQAPL